MEKIYLPILFSSCFRIFFFESWLCRKSNIWIGLLTLWQPQVFQKTIFLNFFSQTLNANISRTKMIYKFPLTSLRKNFSYKNNWFQVHLCHLTLLQKALSPTNPVWDTKVLRAGAERLKCQDIFLFACFNQNNVNFHNNHKESEFS